MKFKVPPGVPPIPEDALRWEGDYSDGHHVIFDKIEQPSPQRWRFGPRGFLTYIEYEMVRDPVDGVMVPRPKGAQNILSDSCLRGRRMP
jgi:hypothetical protein